MKINPDVILINAHGLNTNTNTPLKIPGFRVYMQNKSNEAHDGVAIAVKPHLPHKVLSNFLFEVLAVQVDTSSGPVILSTAYQPPRRPFCPTPDLLRLAGMRYPVYFLGDLNAHHRYFNYTASNAVGRGLVGLLDDGRLQHLGPDFETCRGFLGTGRPDVVLANRLCFHNYHISEGPLTSSDHSPIVMTISTRPITIPTPQRFLYREADWPAYTDGVERNSQQLVLDGLPTGAIDTALNAWYECIDAAKGNHIPTVNTRSKPHPRPSHTLRMLQVMYQAVSVEARTHGWSPHIYHRYKVLQRQLLEENLRLYHIAWGDLLVQLMEKYGEQGKWYREIRRLTGIQSPTPYILHEGRKLYSPLEKEEVLTSHWRDIWRISPEEDAAFDPGYEARLRQEHGEVLQELIPLPLVDLGRLAAPLMDPLTEPVSVEEVKEAIRRLPNKAPGYKRICKEDLVHLPDVAVNNLTVIYNACLASGHWPACWKHATVTMIPKSTDSHLLENQRPISLLEIPGKIFERIINTRIMDHLEHSDVLHADQYGFRRRRGTQRSLALIWERCASVVAQRQSCNIVLRDVKSAFDKIWHFGLKCKLLEAQLPHVIVRLLSNFLDNRTARIRVGRHLGPPIHLQSGVSQGSVLSPTLYILYTSDTPVPPPPSKVHSYADDNIGLSIDPGYNPRYLARRSAREAHVQNVYEAERKISSNTRKTKAIGVAKRVAEPIILPDGSVLQHAENGGKALGLRLNRTGFAPQIKHNRARALRALKPLWRFRTIPAKAKLRLYKSLIRPILEYPPVPLHLATRSAMLKLQAVQNRAIMWITGHWFHQVNRPSIRRLHRRLRLEPINTRLHRLARRTWRALESDGDPNYTEVLELAGLPRVRRSAAGADPKRWWPSSIQFAQQRPPRPIFSKLDH